MQALEETVDIAVVAVGNEFLSATVSLAVSRGTRSGLSYRVTVFALSAGNDIVLAQSPANLLQAVADAQDRDTKLEECRVRVWQKTSTERTLLAIRGYLRGASFS